MFAEIFIQNTIIIFFIAMLLRIISHALAGSLFLGGIKIIFEIGVLVALFILNLSYFDIKNFMVTLIFVVIIFGIIFFFMPKNLPTTDDKYPLKSWILFILGIVLSIVFSSLFLTYY